jgi:hypothetical protein
VEISPPILTSREPRAVSIRRSLPRCSRSQLHPHMHISFSLRHVFRLFVTRSVFRSAFQGRACLSSSCLPWLPKSWLIKNTFTLPYWACNIALAESSLSASTRICCLKLLTFTVPTNLQFVSELILGLYISSIYGSQREPIRWLFWRDVSYSHSHVYAQAFQAGGGRLRTRIVDTDIASERWNEAAMTSSRSDLVRSRIAGSQL